MELDNLIEKLLNEAVKEGLGEAFSAAGLEKAVDAGLREVEDRLSVRLNAIEEAPGMAERLDQLTAQVHEVLREHDEGVSSRLDALEKDHDPDFEVKPAEREAWVGTSIDRHFDSRCDQLSKRCDSLDAGLARRVELGTTVARKVDELVARCDEQIAVNERLRQRCNALGARGDELYRKLDERERMAQGMQKNINALERTVEEFEETSMPGLHRKVNDWGVVFETMANRISGLERVSIRLLNHVCPDDKEEPEPDAVD